MADDQHLNQIVTSWSVVRGASDPQHPDRQAAIGRLLDLYSDSIRRYLLAALKDQAAADEVYQNFALKLVRGDLASADPARGRFRSFVKTTLYRLIVDFHRAKKRQAERANELYIDPAGESVEVEERMDRELRQHWREGLLNHAWKALQEEQEQRGGIYFSLLKTRSDHPEISHERLIEKIEEETGTRPNPGSLRVSLHRARQKFADHLLEAVITSLGNPDAEQLDDELIILNLKKYCAEALARRQEKEADN